MLGINGGEFVLLLVVALVVVGPERLPHYAEQLAVWVRTARRYALSAKERVSEELGEDVGDVDWAALDPRRYDPRRIVREALLDDAPSVPARGGGATARGAGGAAAAAAAAASPNGGAVGGAVTSNGANGASNGASGGPVSTTKAASPSSGSTGGNGAAGAASVAPTGAAVAAPFDDEAT